MNYGLLDYQLLDGKFNIGDYVQSLAARQYLPRVDRLVNREALNTYDGEKTKLILNGWFMHHPENWPPSPSLDVLPISFHINRPYAGRMLSPEGIRYLKRFSEVGCRDHWTAELLEREGVNSYYSGCLTTTLKRPDVKKNNTILFVDALHAVPHLRELPGMPVRYFLSHLKNGNIWMSLRKERLQRRLLNAVNVYKDHDVEFLRNSIEGRSLSSEDRFMMAQTYLEKLASASLVITSRIHCALPCLAFGTPVVFIKYGQSGSSNTYRFRGIIDYMNVLDLDGDLSKKGYMSRSIGWDDLSDLGLLENPGTHLNKVDKLKLKCEQFISNEKS